MTALAKPSSNCKRQTGLLIREGALHRQDKTDDLVFDFVTFQSNSRESGMQPDKETDSLRARMQLSGYSVVGMLSAALIELSLFSSVSRRVLKIDHGRLLAFSLICIF
jgi:hypothetical protein